jgi:hypothetical protein
MKIQNMSIRSLLKNPIFCCLMVGISLLLWLIIDLLGGYRGFHLCVVILPAILVPLLFALIFTLVVLIRSVWSIIRFRNIIKSLVLIIVTIGFWFMPRLCPQRPFLLGLKYRVLKLSSPQELREIASEIRASQHKTTSGSRYNWAQKDDDLFKKLSKYKIFTEFFIRPRIGTSDDNSVDLYWGSALTGHWGIQIADHPLTKNGYAEVIPIDNDIVVFMTPD